MMNRKRKKIKNYKRLGIAVGISGIMLFTLGFGISKLFNKNNGQTSSAITIDEEQVQEEVSYIGTNEEGQK